MRERERKRERDWELWNREVYILRIVAPRPARGRTWIRISISLLLFSSKTVVLANFLSLNY